MNEDLESEPHLTIAERLRQSNGPPEKITKSDFALELQNLTNLENMEGVRDLRAALVSWETRFDGIRQPGETRAPSRSPDQILDSVTKNLDVSAMLADALNTTGGDEYLAYRLVAEGNTADLGPVQRFYRSAVEYNPPPAYNPALN